MAASRNHMDRVWPCLTLPDPSPPTQPATRGGGGVRVVCVGAQGTDLHCGTAGESGTSCMGGWGSHHRLESCSRP